jgi:outer membrane lipoprotein-sorting protein
MLERVTVVEHSRPFPLSCALPRRRVLQFLPAALGLAALPAAGRAAPPRAAVLNKQDYDDVLRIQAYLNDIRTLQSRFQQFTPEGGTSSGMMWLERPGRLRIEYDPPVPILIVATGGEIYYYDKKLQQLSRTETERTPAWFLLRPQIRLGGEVTITRFERTPGALRLTMVETQKPDDGRLTVVMSDKPLELKQWTVVDAQAKEVTVTLNDPHFNGPLNPNLFYWTDPRPTGGG